MEAEAQRRPRPFPAVTMVTRSFGLGKPANGAKHDVELLPLGTWLRCTLRLTCANGWSQPCDGHASGRLGDDIGQHSLYLAILQ
jgi:hypothetical protein